MGKLQGRHETNASLPGARAGLRRRTEAGTRGLVWGLLKQVQNVEVMERYCKDVLQTGWGREEKRVNGRDQGLDGRKERIGAKRSAIWKGKTPDSAPDTTSERMGTSRDAVTW
eukprot:TRINITY_DN19853_c0_g2_i2.p3 TRINITY_DN19853_c0_g2~~TRINITY_DN19853_c0_g2_i2.p3  ORF type:complete len:113 (+),score=15.09 TRINITY_DN19853_c0_g2_i2:1347-1685(+)